MTGCDVVMFCDSGRYGVVAGDRVVVAGLSGHAAGAIARAGGDLVAAADQIRADAALVTGSRRRWLLDRLDEVEQLRGGEQLGLDG